MSLGMSPAQITQHLEDVALGGDHWMSQES